jgi:predicted transcriptional regulator
MSERLEANADDIERDPPRTLQALRAATAHSFPTADIEEMLADIERGYLEEPL